MKRIFLAIGVTMCMVSSAFAQEERIITSSYGNYLTVRVGETNLSTDITLKYGNGKIWDKNKNIFSFVTAFGTYVRPDVRTEVEVMTIGKIKESYLDEFETDEVTHSGINFSLNFLKDFDLGKFKPYVGAGVGIAYFYDKIKYDYNDGYDHYWGGERETNFTFSTNLQTGIMIPVSDKISFDMNARYTYFSDYELFENSSLFPNMDVKNKAVSVTAGLKFNF